MFGSPRFDNFDVTFIVIFVCLVGILIEKVGPFVKGDQIVMLELDLVGLPQFLQVFARGGSGRRQRGLGSVFELDLVGLLRFRQLWRETAAARARYRFFVCSIIGAPAVKVACFSFRGQPFFRKITKNSRKTGFDQSWVITRWIGDH